MSRVRRRICPSKALRTPGTCANYLLDSLAMKFDRVNERHMAFTNAVGATDPLRGIPKTLVA